MTFCFAVMFLALYKLDKLRVDDGAVRGHLAQDPVGRAVVQRRGVVQDEVLVRRQPEHTQMYK